VIEAVPERADLKQRVFHTLGAVCSKKALLASNTSSLSITEIAGGVPHPDRVVSDESIDRALQIARQLGKQAVVASDSPGFIVNRVARPFYLEGLRLVGDGFASITAVDAALREVGFRMGPFELMDLIGLDVNFAVSSSIFEQTFYQARFRPHVLQAALVRAGQFGRKSGRGFYDYSASPAVANDRRSASVQPPPGPWDEWTGGFVCARVVACLINEGFCAVGEGVASAEDVDVAMRLGTNWPKGPFEWARECGVELILRTLGALRDAFGDAYVAAPLLTPGQR
jgi:3-hydroxybutyryl-CoA dehydrogenase